MISRQVICIVSCLSCLGILDTFRLSQGYEYSVRDAFCRDYARSRSSIYSSSYNYDAQNAYNYCMNNAVKLINNYEEYKIEKANERTRQERLREQRRLQRIKDLEMKRQAQEDAAQDAIDGFR